MNRLVGRSRTECLPLKGASHGRQKVVGLVGQRQCQSCRQQAADHPVYCRDCQLLVCSLCTKVLTGGDDTGVALAVKLTLALMSNSAGLLGRTCICDLCLPVFAEQNVGRPAPGHHACHSASGGLFDCDLAASQWQTLLIIGAVIQVLWCRLAVAEGRLDKMQCAWCLEWRTHIWALWTCS